MRQSHHFCGKASTIHRDYYSTGCPIKFGLEYTKCNVLKLRKVCEQSELLLQKEPKKGELFEIRPFSLGNENGRISNFDPIKRGEF